MPPEPSQRDQVTLNDILQSARAIVDYTHNHTRESFEANAVYQDAVIRRLEIIGEAASRISDMFKTAHPDIPWRAMKGMRNILIHAYDNVDILDVWQAATESVPELITLIEPEYGAID